jgi:poly-gamma-glutamate synthesis protein (capsule biosynthesis protein)
MHPTNTPVLTAAKIDCCVLANNHVIDWGYSGLAETLATLHRAGLKTAGAGQNRAEALQPATVWVGGGTRVLVFAYGLSDSGIPRDWAAEANKPGVALLPDLSERQVEGIAESVGRVKRPGDIAVLSIHWGSNWGYSIPKEHRVFAYRAIDAAGIDVVHGHSSHHPKGIEMHAGKPILYGCGDFFNDYEGISGYEEFRSHLVLMYFLTINRSTGKLSRLQMTPLEIKRFRLNRIGHLDAVWLRDVLSGLGTETVLTSGDDLILQWQRDCA